MGTIHHRMIERCKRERDHVAGEINGLLGEVCRVRNVARARRKTAVKTRLLKLISRKAAAARRLAKAESALRSHS